MHASDAAVQQVVNDVEEEDAESQRGQDDVRVDVIISVPATRDIDDINSN